MAVAEDFACRTPSPDRTDAERFRGRTGEDAMRQVHPETERRGGGTHPVRQDTLPVALARPLESAAERVQGK